MSRRKWKTVNVPTEFIEWLDEQLAPGKADPKKAPYGITSRDQWFQFAGALLAATLVNPKTGKVPLEQIQELLDEARKKR